MANKELQSVIELLIDISGDMETPRNTKEQISAIVTILGEDADTSMKVSKALNELDETIKDNNMQQYTRTQLWNVASILEKFS